MMPLFSLVLLLLVPFSFQLWPDGWMVGRWICGSPHATFLPPSWFLSSGFRLTVSTLSLEGLVLCESLTAVALLLWDLLEYFIHFLPGILLLQLF